MDLRKLNEFLYPYNVEIICDNCQKKPDQSLRTPVNKQTKTDESVIHLSDKKSNCKISKTVRNQSDSKKVKANSIKERTVQIQSKPQKNDFEQPHDPFASAQKSKCLIRTNFLFYPPNEILNSNSLQTEGDRKFNIQELLDINRNTPNKIEDIDVERYYYSEKKENHFRNNLTNSTAQPMLMCPEESPISPRDRKKIMNFESSYYDKMALVGMLSRDASPIQTSYRGNQDTPSYRDRTPRPAIIFTPIMKGNDNLEEYNSEHFNLFNNPFGEQF